EPRAELTAYVFVNPLRAFVTVNDPSGFAETLIHDAAPLCAGGGGAPGPAGGAGLGAIGITSGWSSRPLAMNIPGTVYSWPLSCEKCSCQRSSRPGDEWMIFIASGWPPLRVPLLRIATRGRIACTSTCVLDTGWPW